MAASHMFRWRRENASFSSVDAYFYDEIVREIERLDAFVCTGGRVCERCGLNCFDRRFDWRVSRAAML